MDLTQLDLVALRDAGAFAVMAVAFLTMLYFVLFRWPKQVSAPIVAAIDAMGAKFATALEANTAALRDLTRR